MYCSLKGSRILTLLLAAGFVLLARCANPLLENSPTTTNMQSSGSLEINLSTSDTDRAVVPEGYVKSISGYEITLSGTQAMGPIPVSSPVILLKDLPLGDYTVSATAYDADGRTLAAGALPVINVGGQKTDVAEVLLLPVMGGTGGVTVDYDWSGAGFPENYVDRAIAVITPTGGRPSTVAVVITDNGLRYAGELPSGEYSFSCDLYAGGTLVSAVSETIRVFDGLESETSLSFGPEDFNGVPTAPGAPQSHQSGLSLTLRWEDTSDLETGYLIYRSGNGEDFRLAGSGLPANTLSWTDGPVEPGYDYTYRIVAVNPFGESEPQELKVRVIPPVVPPSEQEETRRTDVILGDSENIIPVSFLLSGFINTMNRSNLEITGVSLQGGAAVRMENGSVVVDTSSLPYENEGREIVLNYTVHIAGEPLNDTYSSSGTAILNLKAPLVEKISEEDLLDPVQAFIYDNRADLERKMKIYDPPDAQEIFDTWGRVSNFMYFQNGKDAEAFSGGKSSEADLALQWKLKNESGTSYIEYAKNSVYAGLVSPDGQESDQFTLEATVTSKDDDDDTVGLIIAFLRDGDSNYVLEAARSRGSSSGGVFVEPKEGWGLLVRRLSKDAVNPEIGEVLWSRQIRVGGAMNGGWKNLESRIKVVRNGDVVSIQTTDWDDTGRYSPGSTIEVGLNSDRQLSRFKGRQKYGYFTASQERTSFRDISMVGGMIQDKLFYLNPDTGESEVWWFDTSSRRWIRMTGADIQGVLGYPVEITNPETGETYLVERRGYRRGRWQDWWDRWNNWNQWERGDRNANRNRSGNN